MFGMIQNQVKRFCLLIFMTYLTILFYVTLFTFNHYAYGKSFNLELFDSIKLMFNSGNPWLFAKNVLGNVGLFLPFGFLVPLNYRKLRAFKTNLFLSFSISLIIESCQFLFAKRIFDVDDILLNIIGAAAGWLLFKCLYGIVIYVYKKGCK
ncbi:glycopeptide antibiotics resistance protein [Scopulibacillus daqui]|uniref:Glycopeptide antibiotics resistance protein n=2 Tax=Scopulibacillus daqui TaxID=1469162 RepID=A0ABS2PYS7_9BACL|nr:glycopeptide antibiotics resistance protein [Scopulibacillus daqui]